MTDLEITKKCALAMGLNVGSPLAIDGSALWIDIGSLGRFEYDPLHDDAQAMALVKKFGIQIERHVRMDSDEGWEVSSFELINGRDGHTIDADLNQAVCLCVAKMGTEHE